MAGDDDGEAEKSAFRWTDAARYVVASVVTVLIVAVIVNAIVVFQPRSLYVSVPRGSVFIRRFPQPRERFELYIRIRAQKPSGIARMYFTNITAYLFDRNISVLASDHPMDDCIVFFNPDDMALDDMALEREAVEEMIAVFVDIKDVGAVMDPSYFNGLYEGRLIIDDATLRLDGRLITQATLLGANSTARRMTTLYCRPLVVGREVDDIRPEKDAFCITGDYTAN